MRFGVAGFPAIHIRWPILHSNMLKPQRSDYFTGALSLLLAGLLAWQTPVLSLLDRTLYDQSMRLATETPSPRVAVIGIDDSSEAELGRWPWSREIDARLIERLATAGAKAIAYVVPLTAPQSEAGLKHIERIQRLYTASSRSFAEAGLNRFPADYEQMEMALRQARVALDPDARLVTSMSKAGNVWLPLAFVPTAARTVDAQLPQLVKAAAGQAAWLQAADPVDSVSRQQLLLTTSGTQRQPTLALALAARSLDRPLADMRFDPAQQRLQLGPLKISTDGAGRMWGRFYPELSGKPAIARDSFNDVLNGRSAAEKYRDHIVLIGPVLADQGFAIKTPLGSEIPPVIALAHNVSSILQQDGYSRPQWADWTGLGAGLLVCLYLLLALPRLSSVAGLLSSSLLFGLMLLAELLLLLSLRLWLPLGGATSVLLLGQVLLLLRRGLSAGAGVGPESRSSQRMLAQSLLAQGQLDGAFAALRQCPLDDALLEPLYNLGLAFERKGQSSQALSVFEYMSRLSSNFRDVSQRMARLQKPAAPVSTGSTGAVPLEPATTAAKTLQLGRYQIEKELGKGAMGVVYLGRDPTIGRVVAIKTMALAEEFDSSDLDEVRRRFFREAETAGRLSHPNIVTIYDAGEEHELAYIAMEFLKGRDLSVFTAADQLLPPRRALEIAIQVAEALDYAHGQNVVHRDIKPANIMYEPEAGTVKVTDFGVARITDASKTRTGMVLGTPSYMSPEQLSGKKVDGRSDLFSLASTLFQLLTGKLPFSGDSMAELMFRIANQPHPDILQLQPTLPPTLKLVLDKALAKKPEERFQSGSELALALRRCLNGMKEA